MACRYDFLRESATGEGRFALKDTADEAHPVRINRYGMTHVLFAKDLCLYPYVNKFAGAAALRINALDYSPRLTAIVVKAYRDALDENATDKERFAAIASESPRKLGVGFFRFADGQRKKILLERG